MRSSSFLLSALVLFGVAPPIQAGRLVAVDTDRSLYQIDPATGAKVLIGTVSINANTTAGLARDDVTGTIYVTSTGNKAVYTVDLATGTATLVGQYGSPSFLMHGIEWDNSTGTLYGASDGNLYTISTMNGLATLVGTSGLTSFTNLGYDSDHDVLYATNSITDSFYSVDRVTGAMTLIGPLLGPTEPQALAYDFEQQVLYMLDVADLLYRINVTTGAATLVGPTGRGNLLGLVFIPDPPPGPIVFCSGDGSGTPCPCGNLGAPGNGCASSVSTAGAHLAGSGNTSISNDTLLLTTTLVPDNSALYFQGTAQVSGGMGLTFGDGLRCAGGSILRLGTKVNTGGTSSYPVIGDASVSVKGADLAGDVRTYQVWYRNAAAFCTPSTFNLTNGVEVTWTP